MTQKSAKRPRKKPSLPFEACVSIETPFIYFRIQEALQKLGYILIDLDTGMELKGQVSIPEIGLINPRKPRPQPRRMGFVQPNNSNTQSYSGHDVDAVLIYQDEGLNPEDTHCYAIHVVDNEDVGHWSKVAHQICQQFSIKVKKALAPTVIIGVGGLCSPDKRNPHSAKNAILRKYQKYGFEDSSAVSHDVIKPDIYDKDDPDA